MRRGLTAGLLAAACATSLAACSSDEGSYNDKRGWGDAGVASRDDGKVHVVNQPDGFGNVSIKCDGRYGYLIMMVTHAKTDVPPVVVPDPRCPGYRPDLRTPVQPSTGGATAPEE